MSLLSHNSTIGFILRINPKLPSLASKPHLAILTQLHPCSPPLTTLLLPWALHSPFQQISSIPSQGLLVLLFLLSTCCSLLLIQAWTQTSPLQMTSRTTAAITLPPPHSTHWYPFILS